ncbi:hypothetical protein AGDE_11263 [Angomonas deanei]|uniref:non-specific serine/threonine protein kinase n=1 Tax=Angomonas deanei TaxID=59799 RepID=A0A7G2C6T5_9TRYP|nr:hypothetical protein AGDE_11263 [Angomonas deanei]CAD2214804.1 Protein kinase domain/Protein tyrosine kinase, putative [Angomonas deanei]|eukprot:EPY26498.1 hypothetical protein AGDE_11263 [Angomonas deanei]
MSDLSLLDTSPSGLENYEVHAHLGSGATSDVFSVTNKENNCKYVLKQMPLSNMTDEEQLRAKQEILVMDGVNHPNVVKFRESFASNTSVDIIMEYCECGTLEDLIDRQRYEGTPFPEDVLVEWMAELLCALAHIHGQRILHRDIKTGNIYVTKKNHLKLGDFGVCTILSNANAKAESMIGTPLYFAPEVCDNEFYDERSDVWSLGIVFYEMCTLRRPFEAENLFTLIQKILTEEVAPFNTGLDSQFEKIVTKMLSKDPQNRPTAQELIDVYLEVPKSHPSHPTQIPSRSRLAQQFYGPEITYKKPWPPPKDVKSKHDFVYAGSDMDMFQKMQKTTYGISEQVLKQSQVDAEKAKKQAKPIKKERPSKDLGQKSVKPPTKSVNSDPGATVTLMDSKGLGFSIKDLQMDVVKRRSILFGEEETFSDQIPTMVVEINSSNASMEATVLKPSSFVDDLVSLLDKYSQGSNQIELDQLDAAALVLKQYKQSKYGMK